MHQTHHITTPQANKQINRKLLLLSLVTRVWACALHGHARALTRTDPWIVFYCLAHFSHHSGNLWISLLFETIIRPQTYFQLKSSVKDWKTNPTRSFQTVSHIRSFIHLSVSLSKKKNKLGLQDITTICMVGLAITADNLVLAILVHLRWNPQQRGWLVKTRC